MSCRNLIGIFGGTFDPFHSGHLKALQRFSEKFDFEKILVVPTGIPPHKMQKSEVSADDRLEMTKRGVASVKNAEVWDFEIRNGGKSYTYLTLEEATRLYPEREFVFFAGSDMFLTVHCWKHPDKITKLAKLAVFSRTGDDFEALEQQKTFLEETYGAECFLFYEQPVAVSSTEIRTLLQTGSASAYLPAAVENYIKEKGLYRPREND